MTAASVNAAPVLERTNFCFGYCRWHTADCLLCYAVDRVVESPAVVCWINKNLCKRHSPLTPFFE